MIWLAVAVTLLREILRTLGVPLRVLLYLPRRRYWRARAREVLAEVAASADAGQPADFARFFAKARPRSRRPHVFISAGEASGETHAAALVHALRGQDIRFTCFGGHVLQREGAELLFPLSEHAAMGVSAVLRTLPDILRAYARWLRLLRSDPPDLVVLVDYPGLHVVMAKAARRAHVPVLHYVAPQYWGWGPWRMRRYRRSVDATLTILPFETAFFARFGVPARYVGHPLLDELERHPPDPAHTAELRARPVLCLLPGSRAREIAANLPGMLRVTSRLRAQDPGLRVVLPHRDARKSALIRDLLRAHDATFVEHHEGPLADWLEGARLVLAKSGTGSLEACLHGTPTVVVYQLRGWLSTFGYHNILSVPFIAGANLVAGRKVVPEFCFHHEGGWDSVAAAALELWREGPERARCIDDLRQVRARLGAPGASERVAAIVRTFLAQGGT